MKDYPRKGSPQARTPILETFRQSQNYESTGLTTSDPQRIRRQPSQPEPRRGSEQHERDVSPDEPVAQPWFGKRIWNAFRRWEEDNLELVLENKQSVARDHLGMIDPMEDLIYIANERTYLAWLRTSLSFASIGVAITQLFRLSTTIQPGTPPQGYADLRRLGRPLGATFVGIAVLVLALGVHRYPHLRSWN